MLITSPRVLIKEKHVGDLTQLNENRKIDLNLKTSLQKVHIYKQKHQKRPMKN